MRRDLDEQFGLSYIQMLGGDHRFNGYFGGEVFKKLFRENLSAIIILSYSNANIVTNCLQNDVI